MKRMQFSLDFNIELYRKQCKYCEFACDSHVCDAFVLFLLIIFIICLTSKFVTINPIIITQTPSHCSLESFSSKTMLAVSSPVIGTNNDNGEILLIGYLDIKILQNPYPNSVDPKAK